MGSFQSQLSLFGSEAHPQSPAAPGAAGEREESLALPRMSAGKKVRRKKAKPGKSRGTVVAVPGGAALCQRMFTRIGCAGPPPAFRVEFYPYASLTLTIRRRDEEMIVRFSDLLQRAPMIVLEGAAALLLGKIYRRRTPRALGPLARRHAGRPRHLPLEGMGRRPGQEVRLGYRARRRRPSDHSRAARHWNPPPRRAGL